jgi:hypothetical protein
MVRKRVSIKGIGATIFYDSDQPLLDLMERAAAHIQSNRGMLEEIDGVEDLGSYDLALPIDGETVSPSPDDQVEWRPDGPQSAEAEPLQGETTISDNDIGSTSPDHGSSSHPGSGEQSEPQAEQTQGATPPRTIDVPIQDEASDYVSSNSDEDAHGDAPFEPESEVLDHDRAIRSAPTVAPVRTTGNPLPANASRDVLASLLQWEQTDEVTFDDPISSELVGQVDTLYNRVATSMSTSVEPAKQAMDMLHEARGLLASGDLRDMHRAERQLNEVKMMLDRTERIGTWSQTYGWGLFIYEVLFILVLAAALMFERDIASLFGASVTPHAIGENLTDVPNAISSVYPSWNSMLWGGLGGAMAAMLSLRWHVAELNDFDRRYVVWYVVQPFSGMMLGGIIYLAMAIAVSVAGIISGAAADAQPGALARYWIPSLAACLAGFRQESVFKIVERLLPSFNLHSE